MKDLTKSFLKLGFTAFGGPAAHIAMMQREFVYRLGWLTTEQFLDLVGAANLLPGPSSSEVALLIGQKQFGWKGLILAGICFIMPAVLLVLFISWLYVQYRDLPLAASALFGIKPVVIAIIFQASWSMSKTATKRSSFFVVGLLSALLAWFDLNIPLILLCAGLVSILVYIIKTRTRGDRFLKILPLVLCLVLPIQITFAAGTILLKVPVTLSRIFLYFLKVGSIQFGSGYVLLAFLRTDLVQNWHWLTESNLMDAIAVGQFTPGPVFSTATFIGYVLHGVQGAILATVGIFLPAFCLVGLAGKLLPLIRKSKIAGVFLDGVNVASLALMVIVAIRIGINSIYDIPTLMLALVSTGLLLRTSINSVWLIGLGLASGLIRYYWLIL